MEEGRVGGIQCSERVAGFLCSDLESMGDLERGVGGDDSREVGASTFEEEVVQEGFCELDTRK